MDLIADRGRRVSVEELNTSRLLAHARKQADQRNLDDVLVADVDSHHYENEVYDEFLPFIENEVHRLAERGVRVRVYTLRAVGTQYQPEHEPLVRLTRAIGSPFSPASWLALLGWLSTQVWFYTGLGVQPSLAAPNDAVALLLFLLATPVFGFFVSPLFAQLSRKHEFEADAYACKQASGADLAAALLKLHEDNAATLTPDYPVLDYGRAPADPSPAPKSWIKPPVGPLAWIAPSTMMLPSLAVRTT